METGAARTISFQTICGLAVCNHGDGAKEREDGTQLRCGTSAVVQDRNTRYLSPVAPHKAERGRITKRETHKSRFVTLPRRDIREIRLCIPNKRHLADTWRDTIVFEDARACISLSILSNFNIVATSPGKICFPWNSARISITCYAKHAAASHRASRNLVQRLHYKWRGKCIKYHPIVKLHFNYRKERVWRTLYITLYDICISRDVCFSYNFLL